MIYPMAPHHHHQIPTGTFLHQVIGHHIMTELNLKLPIFSSLTSKCLQKVSINYSISGKHPQSLSTVIHLSQTPPTGMKQLTPPLMVMSNGKALLYVTIFQKTHPQIKLPLHGKQQSTMGGSMTPTNSSRISSQIVASTKSSTIHLTKNMTLMVSIDFMTCSLVTGAGEWP